MSAETTGQIANIPFKPPTVAERALSVFTGVPSEDALKTLAQNSATITTITNQAGYDQCHSARMVLKNTRLEIAKTGEAGREDAVQTSKAIITRQKALIAITQPEEDRLQKIQDDWDAAIKAEKEAKILAEIKRGQDIQDRITELRGAPAACASGSSALINEHIGDIERIIVDDSFAEFRAEAEQAKTVTLASLNGLFAAAMDREAAAEKLKRDMADLERLRAENAERERLARIESDRVAAEVKAKQVEEARAHAAEIQAQREANEKIAAENKAKLDAEAAEQTRLNNIELKRIADERAENERLAEVERQRQAVETARVAEARRQLEADQAAHAEAQRKASEPPPPPPPLPSVNKPRVRMMAEFDSEEVIQILMRHYSAQRNEIVYHLSTTRWAEAAA